MSSSTCIFAADLDHWSRCIVVFHGLITHTRHSGRDHSIPLQCYFKIGVLAVFYVSRYTVTPAAVCDLFEVRSIPGSGRCARLVISRKMHILAQVCCQNTMLAHSNLNILKCHPTWKNVFKELSCTNKMCPRRLSLLFMRLVPEVI